MTPFRIGRKTFVIFFMHFEKWIRPANPLPDPGLDGAAMIPHKLGDPQAPGTHSPGTAASRAAPPPYSWGDWGHRQLSKHTGRRSLSLFSLFWRFPP